MMKLNIQKIAVCFLLTVLVSISYDGYSQEQPSLRSRANSLYERMEYAKAARIFEDLVDVKKPRVVDVEKIAYSYLFLNQYELAENWYARVVNMEGKDKSSVLYYAEALKQNGKYAEAKKQFQEYKNTYADNLDGRLDKWISGCDSAQVWLANPTTFALKNENQINTDNAEFGVFPLGDKVYYGAEPKVALSDKSGMTGQPYLRIFSAERKDDILTYPNLLVDKMNHSPYHISPIILNKEQTEMYVTRTYPGNEVEKYKKDGTKFRKSNIELMVYKKSGDSWTEKSFEFNDVKSYSLGHAALNTDENVLYFASDMPGGQGGVDIWYSERQSNGEWGSPVNAGNVINTAGDEMFPTVYQDILYYSSDGLIGMGGLDVYSSKGSKNNFSKPMNMRYPLNSAADDFSFVILGDNVEEQFGYLSSNRVGGVGNDDIYSFNFAKPRISIVLIGNVKNKENLDIIPEASITLLSDNKVILSKKQSDVSGKFEFELSKKQSYKLLAEKAGFFPDSTSVSVFEPLKDTVIYVNMRLQPIMKVGTKFVLEDIHYDFDKHNIRPDAALILDQLVRTMRDNPNLKIELSSHTDSRGSNNYNIKLSHRRAESAVNYLVSRGINRDRLVAKGYGETRLLNHCSDGVNCTKEEHQANRRTEVEVLENFLKI